jgi:hypothetical protein
VLGVIFSLAALRWIHVLQPLSIPRLRDIAVTIEVLLFTVAVCGVSGIIFGLVPAIGVRRLNLYGTLKDAGRGSAGAGAVWGRRNNFRRVLVVVELALSVILLVGAGLLIRSFVELQRVTPGFDGRSVLTLELTMTGRKYADSHAVLNTYRDLWQRLDRLPGTTASGGITSLPLSGYFAWGPITVEHVPEEALRAQYDNANDPMERSFAALMLYNAGGDVIDSTPALRAFDVRGLRTVREHLTTMTSAV